MSSTTSPQVAVPALMAVLMPNVGPQAHREIFEITIKTEGSYEAAVEYFEHSHRVMQSGVVVGAPFPPPDLDVPLKSINLGRQLTIFYHSTFPPHLQEGTAFTWNFYIALGQAGPDLIDADWLKKGVVVRILGFTGKWEECHFLTILADTRVRISYLGTTHELVFPPDPREVPIEVHYLKY